MWEKVRSIEIVRPYLKEGLKLPPPSVSDLLVQTTLQYPNRALPRYIDRISIGDFSRELGYLAGHATNVDNGPRDVASLCYVDRSGLMRHSIFVPRKVGDTVTIGVEFDLPEVVSTTETSTVFYPKMDSVGAVAAIIHRTPATKEALPPSWVWRYVPLREKDFKAASAAFFLTGLPGKEDIFALFRGANTPELTRTQARDVEAEYNAYFEYLTKEKGWSEDLARVSLYRQFVKSLDLQFFHGNAKSGVLVRSIPERHI